MPITTTITNHRDGTVTIAKRGDPQSADDRRELAAFLAPPPAPSIRVGG